MLVTAEFLAHWYRTMCNCSNIDLLLWGAGVGALAYVFNPSPVSVGLGVAVGILYRRSSSNSGRDGHHNRAGHHMPGGW